MPEIVPLVIWAWLGDGDLGSRHDIFESIALELRHQYAIGYRPPNFSASGKWHHLKVKVNPPRELPHLFVRSRDGYYAQFLTR